MPSPAAGMTLAVYYPFSQTDWYRASIAYLDLQHQGLVVLLLLLSLLMVSNVKYPRFPPIGFRSPRGLFGLAVHVIILGGGLLWPASFLFPLGLFYMAFGVVRAFVLGLMERSEPGAEGAAAPVGNGEIAAVEPPVGHERRRVWGDRRQEPIE
jgi:CDP-diacylglycerol--serine O-phosphatidyltransferase